MKFINFLQFPENYQILNRLLQCETFDSKMNINVSGNCKYFLTFFYANGIKYNFIGIELSKGMINIQFYPVDGNMNLFQLRKSDKNVLVVFAGIFQSIELLLKKCDVNSLIFTADNKKLGKLYNRMIPYIEKRFDMVFDKTMTKARDGNNQYVFKVK